MKIKPAYNKKDEKTNEFLAPDVVKIVTMLNVRKLLWKYTPGIPSLWSQV